MAIRIDTSNNIWKYEVNKFENRYLLLVQLSSGKPSTGGNV